MSELEKICDQLIDQAGGGESCSRFQDRVILGKGGILSRLINIEDNDKSGEDFGSKVIIRDVSRSGLGLLSWENLQLEPTYVLRIPELADLKGILIYSRREATGQYRFGFRLDEWLTEEIHDQFKV